MTGQRTRRVLAVVAVLFGLLLLQGSLCGGSGGAAVPCVGGCDRATSATVSMPSADEHGHHDHATMAFAAQAGTGEHGSLVNLCVTALLAFFALVLVLCRPLGVLAAVRVFLVGVSSAVPSALHRPVLCALRL